MPRGRARPETKRSVGWWGVLVAGGALAAAALAGTLVWTSTRPHPPVAPVAPAVAPPAGAPHSLAQTQPFAHPLVGKPFPDLGLADLSGTVRPWADFRGKPTLVVFWTTY